MWRRLKQNEYRESTYHFLNSDNSTSEYNLAMFYPFPYNQYNFKYNLKERLASEDFSLC